MLFFVLWCRADLEQPRSAAATRYGATFRQPDVRRSLPCAFATGRWLSTLLSCSDGVAVLPPVVPQCGGLPLRRRAARAGTRAAATRYRETACYARGTMIGQPHDGPFAGRWHQQNDSSNSGAWQTSDASSPGRCACDLIAPWVDFDGTPKNYLAVRH